MMPRARVKAEATAGALVFVVIGLIAYLAFVPEATQAKLQTYFQGGLMVLLVAVACAVLGVYVYRRSRR